MHGGAGKDTISGGRNNDYIEGGTGNEEARNETETPAICH